MATLSEFRLELPQSLMDEAEKLPRLDSVLIDARNGLACLAGRAAKGVPGDIGRILARTGTVELRPGDEIPEGWFDEVPASGTRKSA